MPRLRFYADENFPAQAGKFLRSIFQNVEFAVENQKARGKPDSWQLKYAIKSKRILLVLDNDFKCEETLLDLAKKSLGVLLVKSADPRTMKVIQILRKAIKSISKNKLSGKICIASVDKISYVDHGKFTDE